MATRPLGVEAPPVSLALRRPGAWSVPSQCASLGLASVEAASVAIGSWLCSTSARAAVRNMTSMMTPPAAPSGFLCTKRTIVVVHEGRRWTAAGAASSTPAGVTATTRPRPA